MALNYNVDDFIHESDRKAMEALRALPGFDQLTKAFMKAFSERQFKILNLSSGIKLSSEQCPRVYNLLVPICEEFGIDVPDLYLTLDRYPNAGTYGDNYIFINVTSGLLELMSDEEIQTVLAHECGHIVCKHTLYHTMGTLILDGAEAILGLGGLITLALRVAFYYWMRCSEFSADRVSAVFCGGSDRVVDVMIRLAGGSKELAGELNTDLFLKQADEYKEYIEESSWNKMVEFYALMKRSHPFTAVRASSIKEWCETDTFKKVAFGEEPKPAESGVKFCPSCGTPVDGDWAFCFKCGNKLK